MPKRSSKTPPSDPNRAAHRLLSNVTGDPEPEEPMPDEAERKRAAAALGRRGGLKGGRITADRMTPEQLKERATKAAAARWKKSDPADGPK